MQSLFTVRHRLTHWHIILLSSIGLLALTYTLFLFASHTPITTVSELNSTSTHRTVEPFPIGVDPSNQQIVEQPEVDQYFAQYLATADERPNRRNWWHRSFARIFIDSTYQQLASPVARRFVIWPGDRAEAVEYHIAQILHWDEAEQARFSVALSTGPRPLPTGVFYPSFHTVEKDSGPELIAQRLKDQFAVEIGQRYTADIESVIPLEQTLIIASLIEREAYDFTDMRIISGVIWNRLFADMPLQLDATLQYVKGSQSHIASWWPAVRPQDKFLDSPYNTYQHKGLPPTPIASPSPEAILAALNPRATECMFYFHTTDGAFHCSIDYETHVAKLRQQYGRGN